MVILQASEGDISWGAFLLALVGSSAIGAIFGGWLTTWMRGRIEREEAWRTRMIEAAAEFAADLSKMLLTGTPIKRAVSRHEPPDGLSDETQKALDEAWAGWSVARNSLMQIDLLFGRESLPAQRGLDSLMWFRDTIRMASQRFPLNQRPYDPAMDDPDTVVIDCYRTAQGSAGAFTDAAHTHIEEFRLALLRRRPSRK